MDSKRHVLGEEHECVMNFDCNKELKTLFVVDGYTGIMSLVSKGVYQKVASKYSPQLQISPCHCQAWNPYNSDGIACEAMMHRLMSTCTAWIWQGMFLRSHFSIFFSMGSEWPIVHKGHLHFSVGPEPLPVCMKCPLTFSTILSSTSSEVFRDTRCLQFHLVCLTPPGSLLLLKTFKLRGRFMHTGPPCGTRLFKMHLQQLSQIAQTF